MNHPDALCWTRPELDHGRCPSSTECTATPSDAPACRECGAARPPLASALDWPEGWAWGPLGWRCPVCLGLA